MAAPCRIDQNDLAHDECSSVGTAMGATDRQLHTRNIARTQEEPLKTLTRVALSAALTLAMLGSGTAAFADGAEVIHNQAHDETIVIDFTNPCTGQTDQLTLVQSGNDHVTLRPHDTTSFHDNFHGTFTFLDGTTGRFVSVDTTAGGVNGTGTTILHATGTTPAGEPVVIDFHFHFAQNGNGEIVVDFAKGC